MTVTALAGWTYERTSTVVPVPDAELGGVVLGMNLSGYYSYRGLAIPGVGAGVYLDDGALSVDVIPKIATLFGAVGVGAGGTWRDGELGWVGEAWVAVLGGVRLRITQVDDVTRSSASAFFALPLRL